MFRLHAEPDSSSRPTQSSDQQGPPPKRVKKDVGGDRWTKEEGIALLEIRKANDKASWKETPKKMVAKGFKERSASALMQRFKQMDGASQGEPPLTSLEPPYRSHYCRSHYCRPDPRSESTSAFPSSKRLRRTLRTSTLPRRPLRRSSTPTSTLPSTPPSPPTRNSRNLSCSCSRTQVARSTLSRAPSSVERPRCGGLSRTPSRRTRSSTNR